MDKATRIKALIAKGTFTEADAKFLEGATDEQLTRFEATADAAVKNETTVKAAADKEAADKIAADKVIADQKLKDAAAAAVPAVTPVPVTFEDVLKTATAETRDLINDGLRIGKERKAASIKALKDSGRCSFTDVELNAKSQGELDSLVKLASVKVAVDYSGQGTPREETTTDAPPAAPDLNAAIRAAHKK